MKADLTHAHRNPITSGLMGHHAAAANYSSLFRSSYGDPATTSIVKPNEIKSEPGLPAADAAAAAAAAAHAHHHHYQHMPITHAGSSSASTPTSSYDAAALAAAAFSASTGLGGLPHLTPSPAAASYYSGYASHPHHAAAHPHSHVMAAAAAATASSSASPSSYSATEHSIPSKLS